MSEKMIEADKAWNYSLVPALRQTASCFYHRFDYAETENALCDAAALLSLLAFHLFLYLVITAVADRIILERLCQ
ncbi:MAG: hypothetical protein N4A65_01160 [Cohaesibacter sp.]|jgi:hypothetical protein|nr:hypothetical protein [Cohaesibacter sp.]